jgi:hypothetical protein
MKVDCSAPLAAYAPLRSALNKCHWHSALCNRRQYSQSGLTPYLALSGLVVRYPWFIASELAFTMAAGQHFDSKKSIFKRGQITKDWL